MSEDPAGCPPCDRASAWPSGGPRCPGSSSGGRPARRGTGWPGQPCSAGPPVHPATDLAGPVGQDRRGVAPSVAGLEGVEAAAEVGVEPPLDGAGSDPEVGGDVLMLAAPVGRPDDVEPVEVLAVGGLSEGLLEAFGLGVAQLDADHGSQRMEEVGSPPPSTNRTASAGLCIRGDVLAPGLQRAGLPGFEPIGREARPIACVAGGSGQTTAGLAPKTSRPITAVLRLQAA